MTEEDRHLPNGSGVPGRRPHAKRLRFRGRVLARGYRPRDRAQGLTEFLPIPSTAHLRIVPAFAGWEDPGHGGVQLRTMLAVVIYFWRDLLRIVRTWFLSLRRPELRDELDACMGWYVIVATIPIVIFGVAFPDQIESGARNLYLIGVMLIVLGLVLLAADVTSKRIRDVDDAGMRDALQGRPRPGARARPRHLALGGDDHGRPLPGPGRPRPPPASRSCCRCRRSSAAFYGLLEIFTGDDDAALGALSIATVFAFIFGYLSIAFLLRFPTTYSMMVFVVYRLVLGAIVIALTAAGTIS